ncbi:hypothetical protein TNCV_4442721 [Trichonephila clavipes]|nr:hypothetical protein TNCV_4442721 [Trichonephila clavipes]
MTYAQSFEEEKVAEEWRACGYLSTNKDGKQTENLATNRSVHYYPWVPNHTGSPVMKEPTKNPSKELSRLNRKSP